MNILGNRVYLDLPEIKEYKVTITPEVKKQLEEELFAKMDKLKVFAKGEGSGEGKALLDKLNVGDEVFIDPGKARLCPIFLIEDKKKICVSVFDIMHIW